MKKMIIAFGLTGLLFAACGVKEKEDTASSANSMSAFDATSETVALDGTPVTLAGITFTPPSTWTDNGAGGMRKADYSFPAVEGESDPASVTVFYFGPTQGGTVADNIERWAAQIGASTDPAAANHATTAEIIVDGMTVATVEAAGVLKTSMGMGAEEIAQENYRLTGAVVEAPEGNVFFKLTGPDKTATAMNQGFVSMIKGVTKATGSAQ